MLPVRVGSREPNQLTHYIMEKLTAKQLVKKKVKVMYAFSQTAALFVDVYGWEELFKTEHNSMQLDYDYGIKEFGTKKEAEAYISGVNDANGWSDPLAQMM